MCFTFQCYLEYKLNVKLRMRKVTNKIRNSYSSMAMADKETSATHIKSDVVKRTAKDNDVTRLDSNWLSWPLWNTVAREWRGIHGLPPYAYEDFTVFIGDGCYLDVVCQTWKGMATDRWTCAVNITFSGCHLRSRQLLRVWKTIFCGQGGVILIFYHATTITHHRHSGILHKI